MKTKKILLFLLITILVLSNGYLYTKMEKLDYAIVIGTPAVNGNVIERTDFSKPLSDKDDFNTVIFTLIDGQPIDKPEVCQRLADSTIRFNDWDFGVTYYIVNVWFDGNDIIIENNVNSESPNYRKISGSRATELKRIIEKYSINNLN